MKKVIIIFPNISALADFVISEGVPNAEVNTAEQSLTAYLTDEQIVLASTKYEAYLRTLLSTNNK